MSLNFAVGQHVKIIVQEYPDGGSAFAINDLVMSEKLKKLGARWCIPGGIYTRDYKPSRLNVRVDETGTITELFYG